MRKLASTIFRLFLTGVAALLPFVVTIFIASWTVRLADAYVGPSSAFGAFLLTIVGDKYKYPGYLVGYLVVVLVILLLGFLVTRATVSSIHKEVDAVFARIPLFGKIYSAVGQVVDLFGGKGQGGLDRFGGVGEVRVGSIRLLCLLTSAEPYTMADGKRYFLVFVPNSPIPAAGFNMLVPEEDFHRLDMPVEDLVKLVMSLGLLAPQVLPRLSSDAKREDVENQPPTS
jgi:uncharacterized membrane protein